jgi:hypothetical protein
MEVLCDESNRILFVKCTNITLGDGKNPFSGTHRPKDITPLLFTKSTKKKRTIAAALHENTWIRDLNHRTGLMLAHLAEFATLRNLVRQTNLQPQ